MSTCISHHGEFSDHEFNDPAYPLTCDLCGVFDEDAATSRLLAARFLIGDWQANGNSRELGDPTARVWHLAARQLLAVLDGREAHDVDPNPSAPEASTPTDQRESGRGGEG